MVAMHRSPGIYLTGEENPIKSLLGSRLMKAQMGHVYLNVYGILVYTLKWMQVVSFRIPFKLIIFLLKYYQRTQLSGLDGHGILLNTIMLVLLPPSVCGIFRDGLSDSQMQTRLERPPVFLRSVLRP